MSAQSAQPDALEIEVIVDAGIDPGTAAESLTGAVAATLDRLGVSAGHVAVEIVDESRIHELNREHRAIDKPTDVLSFPVDGEAVAGGGAGVGSAAVGTAPSASGPLELGDVVICPAHTEDMVEATVHGVLHLCGFDHETDDGEMLALQDEIVDAMRGAQA